MSSNGGGVPAKRVSRPASLRGGAKHDDVRSLAAQLYHVTASENGSGVGARFNSDIKPFRFHSSCGLLVESCSVQILDSDLIVWTLESGH